MHEHLWAGLVKSGTDTRTAMITATLTASRIHHSQSFI
jgi:hypothetical protein